LGIVLDGSFFKQQWMLPTKIGLLARNLSEKCKDLHLAIVALAGLMSTKKLRVRVEESQ
jgi:hypothetical protein